MHRHYRTAVALAIVVVPTILAIATLPVGTQGDILAGVPTRTPRPSPVPKVTPWPTPGCLVTATHSANPQSLAVTKATTATVHMTGLCLAEPYPHGPFAEV